MNPRIQSKLDNLSDRFEEITQLLASPEVQNNTEQFKALSQEYAQLDSVVEHFRNHQKLQQELDSAIELSQEDDPELKALAKAEIAPLQAQLGELEHALKIALLPKDPDDGRNVFLEIRAGTGGDEAALFAGDLARMYQRYAEMQHWRTETISDSPGEMGGHKELILRIQGQNVYSQLKFESGTHRVQRVPATESQGRIHTSACTVAVLPELDEIEQITLSPDTLRIDTFRASGAGGQHVNKTDSAIRITHLPTGLVVECQDERSQHKNRARALSLLQAKLLADERSKQQSEQAQNRKLQVGSGDRSERIRTYNFPQGRLTDHRINLTLYKLETVLQGDLAQVINPLLNEHHTEMLSQLNRD
ncbi:MAG: peptide chain release factor 1 [Methylococcales bacterium]|nr:peptide chain release factor 1 [Methylococcales bacterium]